MEMCTGIEGEHVAVMSGLSKSGTGEHQKNCYLILPQYPVRRRRACRIIHEGACPLLGSLDELVAFLMRPVAHVSICIDALPEGFCVVHKRKGAQSVHMILWLATGVGWGGGVDRVQMKMLVIDRGSDAIRVVIIDGRRPPVRLKLLHGTRPERPSVASLEIHHV
jgi:hypothetical protein